MRTSCLPVFIALFLIFFSGPGQTSDKTFDSQSIFGLRLNPIFLVVGALDMSFDFKISKDWTLTPTATFFSLTRDSQELSFRSFGLTSFYHFDGAFQDSWIFGPVIRQFNFKTTDRDRELSGGLSTFFYGAEVGYVWHWKAFYAHISCAVGDFSKVKIKLSNSTGSVTGSEDLVFSHYIPDFKVGWTF